MAHREHGQTSGGVTEIKLWTHYAGNKDELAAVEKLPSSAGSSAASPRRG
jgi:hypothetical protein